MQSDLVLIFFVAETYDWALYEHTISETLKPMALSKFDIIILRFAATCLSVIQME